MLTEAREDTLDFVESKLMKAIDDGNVTAMIFFLKTRGKSRGYSERSEFGRAGDVEPVQVTFKINGEPRDSL